MKTILAFLFWLLGWISIRIAITLDNDAVNVWMLAAQARVQKSLKKLRQNRHDYLADKRRG